MNKIHRENDCFGNMLFLMNDDFECRGCRHGYPFGYSPPCTCTHDEIYKCDKCG